MSVVLSLGGWVFLLAIAVLMVAEEVHRSASSKSLEYVLAVIVVVTLPVAIADFVGRTSKGAKRYWGIFLAVAGTVGAMIFLFVP